jgi:hypothetical protein
LDDAGGDLWNFAKSAVFGSPSSTASTPGVSSTTTLPNPAAPTLTPYQQWQNNTHNNLYGTKSNPTPYGNTQAQTSATTPATTSNGMSMDNLSPLAMYGGQRVAGSRPNQTAASSIANGYATSGRSVEPFDTGMGYTKESTQRFGQTYNPNTVNPMMVRTKEFGQEAADQYMNPFIKAALETTSDEMGRMAQIEKLKNNSGMVSKGAFGGSRHGVIEQNMNRDLLDRIGSMFKGGMSDAYDKAMSGFQQDQGRLLQADTSNQGARLTGDMYNEDNRFRTFESGRDQFNKEQGRLLEAAGMLGSLGTGKSNVRSQDIERLLKTGEVQRGIEQEGLDQGYADFLEQRDYPYTQLERLSSILSGNPSKGAITTTKTPGSSPLAQIAGLGLSLATGMPSFGGSAAAGMAAGSLPWQAAGNVAPAIMGGGYYR